MRVFVNGIAHDCGEQCTLTELLEHLAVAPTSCATAVNGAFVARQLRSATKLSPNDHVMTFEPITGG